MSPKLDTAVVLAGGAGTRLRPITDSIPKGMIRVCGKPLLEWIVDWLVENGVRNIVFGVAYHGDRIMGIGSWIILVMEQGRRKRRRKR